MKKSVSQHIETHQPTSSASALKVEFNDNRIESSVQLKAQRMADEAVQRKENRTGMSNNLKSGIENLSGIDMSDVRVHFNSLKPAQLQAHAYAQGTDIHIAPGQEKHLPHEAWHVVQQKQGRVSPTRQLKEKVSINDDEGLEREADLMGLRALNGPVQRKTSLSTGSNSGSSNIHQLKLVGKAKDGYEEDAEAFVQRLFEHIVHRMGPDDKIVRMILDGPPIIVFVSGAPSTYGSGGFDPSTMQITLHPGAKGDVAHENRDRLYRPGKEPQYGEIPLVKLRGTGFGRMGLVTTLYHELGHLYQRFIQKIDVQEMYKSSAGKFMIELHNILQSENRMAQDTGEPLRSSYRPTGGVREREAPDIGRRYTLVGRDVAEVEPEHDERIGRGETARIKSIVLEYGIDLDRWIDRHGRGIISPQERRDVAVIIQSALEVVGENMKQSQVHILQGIIDSAYYFLKGHLG